jgi:SAM-dependent methyltransferase
VTTPNGSQHPVSCCNCGSDRSTHKELVRTVADLGRTTRIPLTIVGCPVCGLVFQNPQLSSQVLARFYVSHDAFHNDLPREQEIRHLRAAAQRALCVSRPWLTEVIGEPAGQRILDIGSCNGLWLDQFAPSNQRIGVELSAPAAAKARQLFGIETHEVDFLANRFEASSFDLVTGLHVIEHFLDPLEALVEMGRLLREGGLLFLEAPSIKGGVFRVGYAGCFKAVHTFYFSGATLQSLLAKAGFEVVKLREIPAYTPRTTLLVPQAYASGLVDVVARKARTVDLATARATPHTSADFAAASEAIELARSRDRPFLMLDRMKRIPVAGVAVRAMHKVARRVFGRVPTGDEIVRGMKLELKV